ncbi:MAG: PQQ-binding-like beta-propeller repeat protein [Pirellulaceae bacterium]|nr:PQQ-binding-like beta-propeller repeat protein [Pirellulaceae bacterium]
MNLRSLARPATGNWTVLTLAAGLLLVLSITAPVLGEQSWPQLKFDQRHSGNVPDRDLQLPLGLLAAIPLGDGIFTSPVIADGCIYAVDGSGTAWCIDGQTFEVRWKFTSRGGPSDVNNVSSPAAVGPNLHYGTTAGWYYVLDRQDGRLIKAVDCGGPVFSCPVVQQQRAYFATVDARVFAVDQAGEVCWTWDFVREVIGFEGNPWSGDDWRQFKQGRVTWRDHFCCSRDLACFGNTVVIPAGGRTVFLEDAGDQPRLRAVGMIPNFAGSEYPAAFGQSIGEQGEVYVQWHRRDNAGRVEVLKLGEDNQVTTDFLPSTQTAINLPGLLSFSSVSIRGSDIYRCRPEEGYGFCLHLPGQEQPQRLGGFPSVASPILTRSHGVYGGLDGRLYVVDLNAGGNEAGVWSFATAFGQPITASAAVCDGRVVFGCEDGYLYVLGPDGNAPLPTRRLDLETIRSPLTGKLAGPEFDWYTNYGDLSSTNFNDQGIEPPLKLKWIRRYLGTFKHLPVCGGGRMYTHTSEGQVFAVEQETGRLLWRKYWPGVYLSFTSPIYFRHKGQERLIVPQAGIRQSRMRCLDAVTGELIWEAPFSGSPSWSRQNPPFIQGNVAIYASGSGSYDAQGTDPAFVMKGDPRTDAAGREIMSWIYTHNNPYYPRDNKPLIWAWDLTTGKLVWQQDFSQYGSGGNDCGVCLLDGKLYYSTFFGYSSSKRKRRGLPDGPNGITAQLDPATGRVEWLTTDYSVTAGCTISGRDGRLYLGGYNQPDEATNDRYVFCLNARDGSLVWKSDPVASAVNVITIGKDFIFSNASGRDGHVLDIQTGKIVSRFNQGYACTRFTCSGRYVLGANMDLIDLTDSNRLVSTGPTVDSRECVGATVSNGRIFYTSQASGLQVSQVAGDEARQFGPPWQR